MTKVCDGTLGCWLSVLWDAMSPVMLDLPGSTTSSGLTVSCQASFLGFCYIVFIGGFSVGAS